MIQSARNAPRPGGLDKRNPFDHESDTSPLTECLGLTSEASTNLFRLVKRAGVPTLVAAGQRAWRRVQYVARNMSLRNILSFPHLMVLVWVIVLLRGERWVFYYKVNRCLWDKWEEWPTGANPHHLIFIADPQLIDPHSYPGRPWPINPLTMLITDNYLRRGYSQLQTQLSPDSLFFLGDLFDGGREWKTAHGDFSDADWAKPHPGDEASHVKGWLKHYGEDYWLAEYRRFSDIYFKPYEEGGSAYDPRGGRKIVASLPGNHDLGFGSDVKIPVRDRFRAYFGEPNRVDVIGNHSVVSVDTVSLSAGTSDRASADILEPIWGPSREFLDTVNEAKMNAIADSLNFWSGTPGFQFDQVIEDADDVTSPAPKVHNTTGLSDLPTLLLTHVPLYRLPGTPCGPHREHSPPSAHPKEENGRIVDHANAISVSAGYQYQNVLNEEDSIRLVSSIGNVVHVFSGDDHDYCEVVHSEAKGHVREITVKSISMAMGVPTPGFLMVSLWNPISQDASSTLESTATDRLATVQTHLCLLPNQIKTYFAYIYLALFTTATLAIRAFLVPILNLTPFHIDTVSSNPTRRRSPSFLPAYRDKKDDLEASPYANQAASSGGYSSSGSSRNSPYLGKAKQRGNSSISSSADGTRAAPWTWAKSSGPRIEIGRDNLFGGTGEPSNWRAAGGPRQRITVSFLIRELLSTLWRVVWMAVLTFAWLTYKG